MAEERLQKLASPSGSGISPKAETMIAEGRVKVNGRIVTQPTKADPHTDKIRDDALSGPKLDVRSNKPDGVVTTLSDEFDRECGRAH